jgi:hypothetical protein
MRRSKSRVMWPLFALCVAGLGCPETTDVGTPCQLVRAGADGGPSIPLLEGEIPSDVDVLASGAIECEDFFCVRHRFTVKTSDTNPAFGKCSRRCTTDESCGNVKSDISLAEGPFTCRALLLDAVTIQEICGNPDNAQLCEDIFGPNRSPYYCAQGRTNPDGGTWRASPR